MRLYQSVFGFLNNPYEEMPFNRFPIFPSTRKILNIISGLGYLKSGNLLGTLSRLPLHLRKISFLLDSHPKIEIASRAPVGTAQETPPSPANRPASDQGGRSTGRGIVRSPLAQFSGQRQVRHEETPLGETALRASVGTGQRTSFNPSSQQSRAPVGDTRR
jgi:hypothetical protein